MVLLTEKMRGSIPFSQHGRKESVSVPLINEKSKCVLEGLHIRADDIEQLKKKDQSVRSMLDKWGLGVRLLQIFFSFGSEVYRPNGRILVIALLGQSLVLYAATQQSLINPTLTVWPQDVNVSATIVVLSFHVVLLVMMLGIIFVRSR
jgi:hypothetical protein